MSDSTRHDALSLQAGVDADAFLRFMNDELMPHLAERFKGPTRVSKADLQAQFLLHNAKSARRFLLVTEWHGAASSVAGAEFENARMNADARTGALLKRLDALAKRSAEKVYSVAARVEVPAGR